MPIDTSKILDLTYRLDQNTVVWPTDREFRHEWDHHGVTPEGYFYAAGHFTSPEHAGTHIWTRRGISTATAPRLTL